MHPPMGNKKMKTMIDKTKEKYVLRGMFAESDDSDASDSDIENSPEEEIQGPSLSGESTMSTISTITLQDNVSVQLRQQKQRGIAHQVWPASIFLCDFLAEHQLVTPEKSILELGAGIGLCGIYLAKIGCKKVIITDLEEAVETMNVNIQLNNVQESAFAAELCWGNNDHLQAVLSRFREELSSNDTSNDCVNSDRSLPLVIAADCVYWECLYAPFHATISALVEIGCVVVIAHVKRWKKDNKFFAMCKKTMNVEILLEVVSKEVDELGDSQRIVKRIYKLSKLTV